MRGWGSLRRRVVLVMAAVAVSLVVAAGARPSGGDARAATPAPAINPSITLTAEPLLGGAFRVGAWAAVRVTAENSGPAVEGELRLSSTSGRGSTFSIPVELATGSRQEHFLYGNLGFFGNRFDVSLVSGDEVQAKTRISIDPAGSATVVAVVAERPQALTGAIDEGLGRIGERSPKIVSVAPEDLPPRPEPWASVDVLVWHDVESNRLADAQLDALRAWLATGGDLVIVNGSTGATSMAAFPVDLLPYAPTGVVDVPPADLVVLLGELPDSATAAPVLTGELQRGVALARIGDGVIAARAAHGQGSVTLVGVDPTTPWLAESTSAAALWARALPSSSGALDARPVDTDQSFIGFALGNLPAVELPRSDHLILLIVGYIVAVGPLNYLVLRRGDRREWAWLTMPVTMIGFAAVILAFGLVLRGGNVLVYQLGIVHGAAGSDRGLADVHVGIYSPSRTTFDVRIGGGPLVTAPESRDDPGQLPLDVVLGGTTIARDYAVGFGAQRSFRAESAVSVPLVEADLRVDGDVVRGSVTNASITPLSEAVLVYGDALQRLGDMAPGESRDVEMNLNRGGGSLWERLYPYEAQSDAERYRSVEARRTILQHLDGGWGDTTGSSSSILARTPVVLAWEARPLLEMDLGTPTQDVGETLYLLPATATVSGPVSFSGSLIQPAAIELDGIDAFSEGGVFVLSRGTIEVEYRPVAFEGQLDVERLMVRVTSGLQRAPAGDGIELVALPPEEQPDSDAPLASAPRPDALVGTPRLQLYDRLASTWVEFEPLNDGSSYVVPEPARYTDASGAFRVRFVVRTHDYVEFALSARLEGTVR